MARPKTTRPLGLYPHWPSAQGYNGPPGARKETLRLVVERLAQYIADHSWSLRQASKAVGVNHVSLHDMLTGNTWPRAEHIAQIERALDVALWPTPEEVHSVIRERDHNKD